MKSWRIAAVVACCLSMAACCGTPCANPYLNCGPVWSQGVERNCDPDYRAGSILNHRQYADLAAPGAPRTLEPIPEPVKPARPMATPAQATANRPDTEHRTRVLTVAQPRPSPKPAPSEPEAPQPPRKIPDLPKAVAAKALPPVTVPAPPGTKEGDTRVLSVTDRRVDEPAASAQPKDVEPKAPQHVATKTSDDYDGWRPVAR